MSATKIIVLLLGTLFLFSCHKENDVVDPDFPEGCDYELGYFELLPESFTAIKYNEGDTLIFSDSLGYEIQLAIKKLEKFNDPVTWKANDQNHPNEQARYCYYRDFLTWEASNDSMHLTIIFHIQTVLDWYEPLPGNIFDQLSINIYQYKNSFPANVLIGIFSKTLYLRSASLEIKTEKLDSLNLFGKVFYNVESRPTVLPPNISTAFYSDMDGLVSFKDIDKKRWRFERIE